MVCTRSNRSVDLITIDARVDLIKERDKRSDKEREIGPVSRRAKRGTLDSVTKRQSILAIGN